MQGMLRRPSKGQMGRGGQAMGMAGEASAGQDPSCQAYWELTGLGI